MNKPPMGGIIAQEQKAAAEHKKYKQLINMVRRTPTEEKTAQIVLVGARGVFIELAEMLQHSLLELGLERVDIWDDTELAKGTGGYQFSIVIRAFRQFPSWLLPGYKILFQTEECWNDRENGVYRYELLYDMNRVLEMYDENCKLLATENVRYCPVGYSPVWEREMERVEEDIDVLFYGSLTDRRKKFLLELGKDYNVKAVTQVYGKDRDELINRSKIVLNIKARKLWSFGPLHCLPAMANKKFMLAERANGGYGPFKPQFHFKEYDGLGGKYGLLEAVKYWINAGRDARDKFALEAYEDMKKNCDFTEILKNAMGDLL
jgi:hypothetical protein